IGSITDRKLDFTGFSAGGVLAEAWPPRLVHVRRTNREWMTGQLQSAAAFERIIARRTHPKPGPTLSGKDQGSIAIIQDLPPFEIGHGHKRPLDAVGVSGLGADRIDQPPVAQAARDAGLFSPAVDPCDFAITA